MLSAGVEAVGRKSLYCCTFNNRYTKKAARRVCRCSFSPWTGTGAASSVSGVIRAIDLAYNARRNAQLSIPIIVHELKNLFGFAVPKLTLMYPLDVQPLSGVLRWDDHLRAPRAPRICSDVQRSQWL